VLIHSGNSGGGKSWLLRLIAERYGIQTIVLDNEGEFASLREAVDVLLVGVSGELPANPRHAALLACRLLEFKAEGRGRAWFLQGRPRQAPRPWAGRVLCFRPGVG
jgi:hypothetical protein